MVSEHTSSDKIAIVTGVSRGYGKAVVDVLLRGGWQVIGDARDGDSLDKAAVDLGSPPGLHTISGDVTNEAHLQSLVTTAQSLGLLKLLVNNASSLGPSPMPALLDLGAKDLEAALRVNSVAPLQLFQIAASSLGKNRGVVINVSSDAAAEDYAGWGAYSITKVALEKLTSILALEYPEIRFYALDPGDMRTQMHQAAFPGQDISDRPEPEVSAPAVARLAQADLPSGRYRASDLLS